MARQVYATRGPWAVTAHIHPASTCSETVRRGRQESDLFIPEGCSDSNNDDSNDDNNTPNPPTNIVPTNIA